ncbi:MAG: diguanylate cyclase, partial [Gammaproteobacteria bacterium]|nr:diguanylate cyclase [Gammaproteobacteria bacterium]
GDRGRQVLALLAEPDAVWVGTAAGLDRLDPASGARTRVLALPAMALATGSTQALLRAAHGPLWYATAVGLYRIQPGGAATLVGPASSMQALLRDRSGRIWAGGDAGLFLLQDQRTLLPLWPRAGEAAAHAIRALAEASDGHLWFAVAAGGLRRFDPRSGASQALRQSDGIPATLPEDGITALLIDNAGLLWVGGQLHGVAVADSRGARFQYLARLGAQAPAAQPAEDSVRAIHQSRDRRLWLGTDDGRLLREGDGGGQFDDLSALLPAAKSGAPLRRVMAFADNGDGQLWLATTGGLFRLDPIMRTPAIAVPVPGVATPSLRSLARDRDGSLWLGTSNTGLLRFQPATGAVQRYPFRDGDPDGLANPMVHALLLDRRGQLWIGTGNGLDLLDPRSDRIRHFRQQPDRDDGLAGNLVRALWQGEDGAIWVGTHGGLSRIVQAADGSIRITQPLAATLPGQPVPVIFSVVADAAGDLWMGTDRGLLRYRPGDRSIRRYAQADGLQDVEFNGGAAARLHDGRMAFGGVSGLNLFDPERIVDSEFRPPLRLLSVQVGARDPAMPHPLAHADRLSLPETARILRLRIGALDYLGQGRIHYRYRMHGLDGEWIDNGTRSEITYTLLPAGDYLLRAQATNRDGVWNPQELQLPIRVTPPAWRHPLALAGYALLAAAILALLWWRWRQRRQRERGYFDRIRDREERLKLALWASGEQFWDYDLERGELHRMRVSDDVRSASDIQVETEVDADHQIHRDGRMRRIAGTARDITHSRNAERERRIASEVLRSMSEAVSVLDRNFNFIWVNPAFLKMTGYGDVEVLGRNSDLLDSAQHDPEFYRSVRGHIVRQGRWTGEMWQQRKDGEEFLCAIEIGTVPDGNAQHPLYVSVLNDITEQKRAEQELRYLANFDTLTNLPNRALLAERLSRAIVRARRQEERIAVLFLDLDRFKDINDSLGHAAGDRILRAAAVRLQDTVGQQHTVARLGGDEFTVVLENLEAPEQADKIAREIITAFEAPLLLDDRLEVAVTPSIGISLYPDHAQVPTELLKQADTAMYQAKAAGRRTYMRYDEAMDVAIRRRATLSGALRKVLDRGELRLVYQPRLALVPTRIVGVETLLRWRSEEYGEVPPEQFIPLAEESGLILEIGEWVLREACLTL